MATGARRAPLGEAYRPLLCKLRWTSCRTGGTTSSCPCAGSQLAAQMGNAARSRLSSRWTSRT
eukprot:4802479-Pleurochrysis_carterae.AAC.1